MSNWSYWAATQTVFYTVKLVFLRVYLQVGESNCNGEKKRGIL